MFAGSCQLAFQLDMVVTTTLDFSLSVCQSVSLPVCQSVSLSVCQSVSLSVCQSVSLSVCQSVSLSVCQSVVTASLPVCQSASLPAYQSVFLPVCQSASLPVCPTCGNCQLSSSLLTGAQLRAALPRSSQQTVLFLWSKSRASDSQVATLPSNLGTAGQAGSASTSTDLPSMETCCTLAELARRRVGGSSGGVLTAVQAAGGWNM